MSSDGVSTYYNVVDFTEWPRVDAYLHRHSPEGNELLVSRDPNGRSLFPGLSGDDQQLNWMWISNDNPVDRALYIADLEND